MSGYSVPDPQNSLMEALPELWRKRAEYVRRYAMAEIAAMAYETVAEELERALRARGDEVLTLSAAAAASGYSADHLRRLVKGGKIPNLGRHSAPRVRRADLPLRPTCVAARAEPLYDVAADARSLAGRRKETDV